MTRRDSTTTEITGTTAADFSRIRNVRLGHFTIDRLLTILDRLDQQVDISVSVTSRRDDRAEPGPEVGAASVS